MRTFRDLVAAVVYCYITTEFHCAKRDSGLSAFGGVMFQRFEFTKVCMGKNVNRHFSRNFDIFVIKMTYLNALLSFLFYYTAISRKVVGKGARDNPERYCGWFLVDCFSKKFQRMAREAMDVCLRVLKESNKSRFDSYSVRNSVLIISHITFRDCRVHSFSDNLSRNSCI